MKIFWYMLFIAGFVTLATWLLAVRPAFDCFSDEDLLNQDITTIAEEGYVIVRQHFQENETKTGVEEKLSNINLRLDALGSNSWVNQYEIGNWEYEFIIHQCLETSIITESIDKDGEGKFYTEFNPES